MKISDDIVKKEFIQREYGLAHPTYDKELDFYQLVSSGNVKALSAMLSSVDEDESIIDMRGKLSENKLRNRKYHEIVLVAMISRFCIEEGMEEMESYNLSDYYINRIDMAADMKQVVDIHNELIMDYAGRMRRRRKKLNMSPHTVKAVDYIYDHLHERIEISKVAEFVGVERSYLSKLFHKEMGQTLSSYAMEKKLETARNMLLYSDFSCTEISQYLSFASNSYFAKCFRDRYGFAPVTYRRLNYRKHWKKSGVKKQSD